MKKLIPYLLALGVVFILLAPIDLTSYGIPYTGLRRYGTYILTQWLVFAVAAMGVNLIMGYAGQETLAQAGFMGLGAYLTALLTGTGLPNFAGTAFAFAGSSWLIAFLCSGVLCFIVGIVLGFPALRVQKHYLAFVTLAFAIFLWLLFRNEQWLTGGPLGIRDISRPVIFGIKTSPYKSFFYFVAIVTAILTFVMWYLLRSPWGRAFTAIRENPIRAESLGVDVRSYKLLAFAIGSAYGGFAGALYAPLVEFIDPSPFQLGNSLMFLMVMVVGGMGSFLGPFVGAAVYILLPEWLRAYQEYALLIFAIMVMVMIRFAPDGFVGLFKRLITPPRRPHSDVKAPTLESLSK
jgi:branched-chain amino acid transport system permease protein